MVSVYSNFLIEEFGEDFFNSSSSLSKCKYKKLDAFTQMNKQMFKLVITESRIHWH